MRRPHCAVRRSRTGLVDGRLVHLWALGLRAGYWPCLDAFFVELSLGPWRPAVWFGRPLSKKLEATAP